MLEEGTAAPPFTAPDHEGGTVSLEDLRGGWVVLWWYAEAATSG